MATQVWVLAALLIGPLLVISLLEIGCGKIAPAAENHSTRKRLIAAAIVVTAAILGHWLRAQYFFLVLAAIAVTPACFGGLLEETAAIPSVYIPFVRWNFIGRLAGRLLYPGWAAGLWFFAVTAAILFGCGCRVNGKPPEWFAVWSLLEAILAPLFLARLFFRRAKSVLPFYFAIQLVLFVTAIVCSVNVARTYFYLFSWIPTLGFFWCLWSSALASHGDAVAAVSALIVSFIGLLVLSAREWRTIKAMEREAAKLL